MRLEPAGTQTSGRTDSLTERLLAGAERLLALDGQGPLTGGLRPDQASVFRDSATYVIDVATRPGTQVKPPFARIVLPPRTGKTVIAAHLLSHLGLPAVFVVPTLALCEQTRRELLAWAPELQVGVFSGERKDVVEAGINVMTYAILTRSWEAGALPRNLRESAVVIADEAHHAMTTRRHRALTEAFSPGAIRLALTATPDYGLDRRLATVFPDLVHEVELAEALRLGLLAPARVWVAEVDADASTVRLLGGDYEAETLGRLMSAAPFLRAVQRFRYSRGNASIPALVACASRQQAYDLWRYLQVYRPPARPEPALILGETPAAEREGALAAFEAGELDTLIQVGVLIEGWSSLRCKLLIDLAPSASRVRATQKTFRVMTRHGDAEARIYVILPVGLPRLPILPMDLLGAVGEYVCGSIVGESTSSRGLRPLAPHPRTPIASVRLKHRIVLTGHLGQPALDAACPADVRAVLATCPAFDPARPVGPRAFRWLWFAHPTFTGRGDFLLAWLGVEGTGPAYLGWLARLYPEHLEALGDVLLAGSEEAALLAPLELEQQQAFERLAHLADRQEARRACAGLAMAIEALASRPLPTPVDLETAWSDRDRLDEARALVEGLPTRLRDVLLDRLGWGGEEPLTLDDIGALEGCSGSRVAQMLKRAICLLQVQAFSKGLRVSGPEYRQKQAPPPSTRAEAPQLAPEPAPWSSDDALPVSGVDPDLRLRLRLRELVEDGF